VARWRAFRVHVCPGAVGAGRTARVSHLMRLALVTGDAINLLACNLVTPGRGWCLDHQTVAPLTRHLMHVSLMAIECLGHGVGREVESHALPTQNPHPQGVMMTGKDRVGQLVNALRTGLAQIPLTFGLGSVAPLCCHLSAITRATMDTVRPAQVTNGLNTFGVVDERLHVYHGARIAYGTSWNKYQKPSERPGREGTLSTPWNPY
jgi:hypothetical protein